MNKQDKAGFPNNYIMYLEISLTKHYSTECMERKKSEHIQRNKQEKAGFPSHDTTCHC